MTLAISGVLAISFFLIFANRKRKITPTLHSTPQNSKRIESPIEAQMTPNKTGSIKQSRKLITKSTLLRILRQVNERLRQELVNIT